MSFEKVAKLISIDNQQDIIVAKLKRTDFRLNELVIKDINYIDIDEYVSYSGSIMSKTVLLIVSTACICTVLEQLNIEGINIDLSIQKEKETSDNATIEKKTFNTSLSIRLYENNNGTIKLYKPRKK